ncbi:MAG: signal recognition particle-docking protein FtsY [Spirochaetia bacterium]|nr:signal recognition particle-docking protein FtsY [Spirochaetia bacterium]
MKLNFGKKIASIFNKSLKYEDFFEDLEDLLVEGDLGASAAMEVSDDLKNYCSRNKVKNENELLLEMKNLLSKYIETYEPCIDSKKQNVFLVLGVNGVGKTTTIAKMASRYMKQGETAVLGAADTFRAAAIDQLELHAERLGCRIVKQRPGADPGAVVFDTIESAVSQNNSIVLIDTAGRMHTKKNLVKELQKLNKIIMSKIEKTHFHKILVIDATTGQNGLRQAEMFHEAVGIDAVILTKYDSASKGGTIIQIGKNFSIPIAFVGVGEKYDDLNLFDKNEFLDTLLGLNL